jgi:aminopeptidase YwaD
MGGLEPGRIAAENLEAHLRALTVDIGVRLAGSPGEKLAADYIAGQLRLTGAGVSVEEFPVRERAVEEERLEVSLGGRWQAFPCSLFSSTPGTDGRAIEAPLVFFASQTEYARSDLSCLQGKAVVHLGCHVESRDAYRRLMEARPAFLLFVDSRYPGSTPLADGMFPAYTKALGAVPVVNVAYMDAWRWAREGAAAARLRVRGGMRDGVSQNVIAELPGTDPDAGLLFVGGHHDTQAASPGADDNATGSAGVIELTRILAPLARRRTIRLISFGAEEQLSVGSAAYVRRHRAELRKQGRFMFNLDAYGSLMGWTIMACNGPRELMPYVQRFFSQRDLWARLFPDINPYGDHFPFVAAGMPAIWLGRQNCAAGRFFHHRPDDDMSRLSLPVLRAHLDAVAALMAELASADPLPFAARLPARMARETKTMWNDLYGGWEG